MRRVLRIVICQAAPYGVTQGLDPGSRSPLRGVD
jgi:hypothetical protein